jgi:hypothetical protein
MEAKLVHNTRMRKLLWIGALAAAGLAAADNRLSPEEKKAGWKLLFDGKTYAGWEDPSKKSPPGDSFTIENGMLKALAHCQINEDLFTRDAWSDFELQFDWKISPAGNSGVKYRIQDRVLLQPMGARTISFEALVNLSLKDRLSERPKKGQEYVIGLEYQVLDNQRNPDARRGTSHQAGALYDIFPPARDATRPVGEFNHSRLLVKGDHVEHWLNEEKVVDGSLNAPEVGKSASGRWGTESPVYHMLAEQPRKTTRISLQNHESDAWFKNLKIRKL